MPRFVILDHDFPVRHWDLFLEAGAVLRAWRLPETPTLCRTVVIEPSADHRLFYLDYEGPISGGRGIVQCFDRGTFDWEMDTHERLRVRLHGSRCSGTIELWCDATTWYLRWTV